MGGCLSKILAQKKVYMNYEFKSTKQPSHINMGYSAVKLHGNKVFAILTNLLLSQINVHFEGIFTFANGRSAPMGGCLSKSLAQKNSKTAHAIKSYPEFVEGSFTVILQHIGLTYL